MKNKALTIVLSVLIAFGLWLYVITVVNPESENTYYDIPVTYQNESVLADRGLMIVSDIPKVTLRLSGNRTDLVNLNESNIKVLVNVASIESPGTHLLGYGISFPSNVASNSVTKQQGIPNTVTLKVERKIKKTVDVKLEYLGAVPEGFLADKENAELDYTTIEVSGPESVVNQIQQAVVQVNLDNESSTIAGEYVYTLCDGKGEPVDSELITTNVEKINLTVKIQKVKELKLSVNVVDGGGATSDTCKITIEPEVIRVSGSDTLLADLEELSLGTIDLGELADAKTLKFPITLPEGITNQTGVTEAVVNVQFPDLITDTFHVTRIVPQNVPDGFEVDMITQALEVTIRGPKEIVEKMVDSDITAYVDFTGAEAGTATMKVTFSVDSAYEAVGAVGSYSVSATLKEIPEGR